MNDEQMLNILSQLHGIERFSLANYLRDAHPWTDGNTAPLRQAVLQIADQQQKYADRLGELIVERDGYVEGKSFPLRFTAFNDLSFEYLASHVMEDQERIIREVKACTDELAGDFTAHSLALEILGAEQGHLENLRELRTTCNPSRNQEVTPANEVDIGNERTSTMTTATTAT